MALFPDSVGLNGPCDPGVNNQTTNCHKTQSQEQVAALHGGFLAESGGDLLADKHWWALNCELYAPVSASLFSWEEPANIQNSSNSQENPTLYFIIFPQKEEVETQPGSHRSHKITQHEHYSMFSIAPVLFLVCQNFLYQSPPINFKDISGKLPYLH